MHSFSGENNDFLHTATNFFYKQKPVLTNFQSINFQTRHKGTITNSFFFCSTKPKTEAWFSQTAFSHGYNLKTIKCLPNCSLVLFYQIFFFSILGYPSLFSYLPLGFSKYFIGTIVIRHSFNYRAGKKQQHLRKSRRGDTLTR